jgi:carotenoid cleavage dioxygenase-like enzyme
MKFFIKAFIIIFSFSALTGGYLLYCTMNKNNPSLPAADASQSIESSADKSLGYSSLTKEVTIESLQTKGTIPQWLSGSLLRNGPAQFEINDTKFNHWFDGFAMIHRFTFNKGTVSYQNKFLDTTFRRGALKTGKLPSGFGQKEESSWFSKVGKLFEKPAVYDNANVHITSLGKNMAALTETPHLISFHEKTLESLGPVTFTDKLDGHVCTAHPITDPETQESFNILTNYGNTSYYQIFKIKPQSTHRELVTSIATDYPSYIHTFALTKKYVIILAIPLVVNPLDLLFSTKPFIENFTWKPERETRLIVVERSTGKQIDTFKTEPFFFFHLANSFDEKDDIVIDVVAYPDHAIVKETKLEHLRTSQCNSPSSLKRIIINVAKKTVTTKSIGNAIELPRFNEEYTGKPYTFIYGVNNTDKQLIKINTKTGELKTWQETHCYAGEPVFIAKPNAQHEDDGILLSVVLNAQEKNSFLLILNAQDMKEIGRAIVPHHIPFGFHGNFYKN